MHEIVTEIDLPASAARVWAVLTDFASYRKWNPVIESIDGSPSQGGRSNPPGARQHLAAAETMYRDMGMRFWLDRLESATAGRR